MTYKFVNKIDMSRVMIKHYTNSTNYNIRPKTLFNVRYLCSRVLFNFDINYIHLK